MIRIGFIMCFLAAGCLTAASGATALTPSLEVAIGYDDNPAEVTDMDGSGVTRYRVLLEQTVFGNNAGPEADLFFEAGYGQYFSVEDDYQLLAGANLVTTSQYARFQPGLFAEAAVYRDDLVVEDERDELILGGFVQWLVDARLTLSLRQSFSRTDFQNRVSLPGQRHYFFGKGKGRGGPNREPADELITFSRKDDTWTTEITAAFYPTPYIQTDLSCRYRDIASSADFESFQEFGASAKLGWFGMESTELFLSGFWSRLNYENAPQLFNRRDDYYGFGAGGNLSMGNIGFFIQFDQAINDSPVPGEDFKKAVVQCGAVYAF